MTCKNCGRENRQEASFCRFCGEALAQESTQQGLIAKDAIVPILDDLDKKLQVAKAVVQSGTRIGLNCLVLGDSGTGKKFIADMIASKMLANGVVKKPATKVDAAEWDEFAGDFEKKMASLKDGILLITNAQKLLPTTKAQEVNQLDKLFNRMHGAEGAQQQFVARHQPATAAEQAEDFGHSYEREVAFLTVHSVLHLLGYDHVNSEEEELEMRQHQRAIMRRLGLEVRREE